MTAQALAKPVSFGQRYSLTKLLAVGGMAEIYLARQNAMAGFEKDVVIKRLKPELAGDPRIVHMFLDEARISAVLNHPNIVHVYDVAEQDGIPYIAMEYIVGEELNDLCRRGLQLGKFLPLEHAVELLRQAAAGLGYFHAKQRSDGKSLDIVHCDISPTNLLVTEDGFLKVIDFGIARSRDSRFRDDNAVPGKLSYMAPEQAQREKVDHRSDIYALGIVLYEITVGKRLFKGPASEVVDRLTRGDIKPPTFVRKQYPGALESVVMRALELHPDDRYQSAYDLADDLDTFLRESGLRSAPVTIARYLDELSVAAGGVQRPELVAEAVEGDDDDLDFDRGMFAGHEPMDPEQVEAAAAAAAEWDEYEEGEDAVAAALGVDPDMLHSITRTPLPDDAAHVLVGRSVERDATDLPDTDAADVEAVEAAKPTAAKPTAAKPAAAKPTAAKPAAAKAARQATVDEDDPVGMHWLIIGGVAAIATVVGAYLILS